MVRKFALPWPQLFALSKIRGAWNKAEEKRVAHIRGPWEKEGTLPTMRQVWICHNHWYHRAKLSQTPFSHVFCKIPHSYISTTHINLHPGRRGSASPPSS